MRGFSQVLRFMAVGLLLSLFASLAYGHKASDSFVYYDQDESTLRVDVALRDLALVLPLDRNHDQLLSGAELRASRGKITGWTEQGLRLSNDNGVCRLKGQQWGLSSHSDGPYAAALYQVICPDNGMPTTLQYNLLFEQDPLHRGLLSIDTGAATTLKVATPDQKTVALAVNGDGTALALFGTFLYEGVLHLLIGLDHILFLLVLILPATLRKGNGFPGSRPGDTFRSRLWSLAGIVTAFTVAHSITLGLAAFNVVALPIAWVETFIALSIALAALNVVWPVLGRKTWKLAFGFGLVHGFGFASVLGDLTNGVSDLALALAGFNIGVELGQLALLVVAFPALYLLASHRVYERAVVPVLLVATGALSLLWVVERAPVF